MNKKLLFASFCMLLIFTINSCKSSNSQIALNDWSLAWIESYQDSLQSDQDTLLLTQDSLLVEIKDSVTTTVDINSIIQNKDTSATEATFCLGFNPQDSSIYGVGACNRFFGKYKIEKENTISISVSGVTMMTCPNIEAEQSYFNMLNSINSYEIKYNELRFFSNGTLTAKFTPSPKLK